MLFHATDVCKWRGTTRLTILSSLCSTCSLMCRPCICVWGGMWNHEHLRLSRGAPFSVHASASPARSHPQLLYLRKGGGGESFPRMLFPSKALIDKANTSKAVWKNYLKAREGNSNPWVNGQKARGDVWMPKAPCVSECQMIIWQIESPDSSAQLENTPAASHTHIHTHTRARAHTHILLLICCLPKFSASTATATTTTSALPSPLNLVLSKRKAEFAASSLRQPK